MFIPENSTPESAPGAEPCAYAFGPFTLDLQRAVLLKDEETLDLRPKTFDVLRVLVEHPRQLLEREVIMRQVWPGLVVTDDSLTQCLTEIRRALGDDERTIIRTVPRRGYRFELPVQARFAREAGSREAEAPAPASGSRSAPTWALAALLLALGAAAAWWWAAPAPDTAAGAVAEWRPPPASVAVLAFADMSPAGDQEYLADGLAEEILNLLARQSGLTVIARTSSFAFKGQNQDIGTIARRLNVAHVLEGSVRKAGERVRVTAQLVDGRSGAHLWSETFDRQLDDVFAAQDEIAHAVAGVLQQRLLGEGVRLPIVDSGGARSPDPAAWELYLRGRYLYGRRMAGDRLQAQRHFEQALRIDPQFAAAWVALAAISRVRAGDVDVPDEERLTWEEAIPLMRRALENALALDPANPEALLRMAHFDWRDGDFDKGTERMERAMRTGRNHALVQALLGGLALALGDPVVGAELQGRAVRIDPLSATHVLNNGHILYVAGRIAEADAAFREAATLNPENARHTLLQRTWIAIHEGAFATATKMAKGLPPGVHADVASAMLAWAVGDGASSDAAVDRLRASPDPEAAAFLAIAHAYRGESDATFLALNQALDDLPTLPNGSDWRQALVELSHAPFLRPLHGDPRWQAWQRKVADRVHLPGDDHLLALLRAYAAETPGT